MAAQTRRQGKFFAAAMALLTMLVSAGVLSGPKLRDAMKDYPVTFENTELPSDKPLPVTVTVEQEGKSWAGSIPRVK